MSLQHFSHDHPLVLIRKVVDASDGGDEMLCYACHQPILPPSAAAGDGDGDVYICGEYDNCDDSFCLHKKCAESPNEIQHPMHDPHPLTLQSRPPYFNNSCRCNVCGRLWELFTYNCDSCEFDVCITCAAVGDRSFRHVGHGQHILTLTQREALFRCDACGTEAKDSSYACSSCEFWMHKSCALLPPTMEADFIHKHPLLLAYSLPPIHRSFWQYCRLCKEKINTSRWLYYCDKCTYFAHIKCIAKRILSGEKYKSEAEPPNEDTDEDDLVLFPVDNKESFIDVIAEQFGKGNINIEKRQGAAGCSITTGDHLQTTIDHWSHEDHPLILLEDIVGSAVDDNNDPVLICNGCIQPITPAAAHPFYGCVECNFFLHLFCLQLPHKLPAGTYSGHPQHPLTLNRQEEKFFCVRCAACLLATNGFYYRCTTCDDIRFDIRCCFLPNRIKHQSHNHPLLHSAPSHSHCNACGYRHTNEELFKCKRGCKFQMHTRCALLPGTMRHRWDPHPIPLIYPPFDHEGLIYCEICESEIDTNYWLYHCRECDHSFHTSCLRQPHNVKLGDTLVVGLHKHSLTFVRKRKSEYGRPLSCCNCNKDYLPVARFIFECANCDVLLCETCVLKNMRSSF